MALSGLLYLGPQLIDFFEGHINFFSIEIKGKHDVLAHGTCGVWGEYAASGHMD